MKIFNPFNQIAGAKSLIIGLTGIALTIVAAHFNNMHFPDTLTINVGLDTSVKYLITQTLANWLILSTLLYFAALLFSKSSVRAIDIYGTQAVSRLPHLIAAVACFSNVSEMFGKYILWKKLNMGPPIVLTTGEMALAIVQMTIVSLVAIWVIVLSVNAFKVSANLKGGKLATTYVVSLILSIALSGYLSYVLLNSNF